MDRYSAMRIFAKVAELESFTEAADQLGIAKASATTAVQELETLVQARLLNRTTRRVRLTSEGSSFLERCKDLLSDTEELASMFQVSGEIKGRLRIDMTNAMARDVIVPKLPEFFALYPQLEIELQGSDRRLDLLREGIDCAIRTGRSERGLSEIEICEIQTVNVASPTYLKRYGKPKTLEDLKNHLLIHYVLNFAQSPEGFEYFDGEKLREIKMKSKITVASVDAYKAACLAGLGIIQNPFAGVRDALGKGQLIEILPRFRAQAYTLKIVYVQRRHQSKRIRAFVDWCEPILREYLK